MTSNDGQKQRELNVLDRGANGLGSIADHTDLDRRRNAGHQPRQQRLDLVDGIDDVGAGLLVNHQEHAALTVGPGRLLGVFRSRHRLADVADPQRAAVAVGNDDVVPVLGVQHLVVGVDRVGAFLAVDVALGTIDRGDRDLVADILEREALGHQFRRIDLDADRRLLLAANRDLRHAGNLTDLLGELGVDGIADCGQRQGIGCRRQQQDRRIRRIDLSVGRRGRKVFRQLAAGAVDAGQHVIGGAVDVAVEVELDGDRGGAEITR